MIRTVLGHALHDAEAAGLVDRNAARLSRPIKLRPAEVEPFSIKEAQRIVAMAEDDEDGAMFLTGILLGMRQGEVLGLKWDDVDLESGVIKVRRHLKREGGRFVLGDLKTHLKGRRDLQLPARLLEVLREHRLRQARLAKAAEDGWNPWNLVFTTAAGNPIEKTNFVRRMWKPFLSSAGVAYRPFHATRHTAASVAYAAGIDTAEISRTLGHSSERTTQDVYKHVFARVRSAASEAGGRGALRIPSRDDRLR